MARTREPGNPVSCDSESYRETVADDPSLDDDAKRIFSEEAGIYNMNDKVEKNDLPFEKQFTIKDCCPAADSKDGKDASLSPSKDGHSEEDEASCLRFVNVLNQRDILIRILLIPNHASLENPSVMVYYCLSSTAASHFVALTTFCQMAFIMEDVIGLLCLLRIMNKISIFTPVKSSYWIGMLLLLFVTRSMCISC